MTFGIISHKLEYFHSKIAQWAVLKKRKKYIFLILILRKVKIIQNNFQIHFREARDLSFNKLNISILIILVIMIF